MSIGDTVRQAITDAGGGGRPSIAQTVAAMGGTRAAALQWGVSQRTVQRYIAPATTQQHRTPSRKASADGVSPAAKVASSQERTQRRQTANRIAEAGGLTVNHISARMRDPSGKARPARSPKREVDIDDEDELDALLAAYQGDDDDELERAFAHGFYDSWGEGRMNGFSFEDVEELSIDIG